MGTRTRGSRSSRDSRKHRGDRARSQNEFRGPAPYALGEAYGALESAGRVRGNQLRVLSGEQPEEVEGRKDVALRAGRIRDAVGP